MGRADFAVTIAAIFLAAAIGISLGRTLAPEPTSLPPDGCRPAATALYEHVGAMFDEIAQEALLRGGFVATYYIESDGEVFPGVWHDFVTACVPPPPAEGGQG